MEQETWTVGRIAEQLSVSVRTLHHYDEIGLLRPSERTYAGYRLYTTADLGRLQAVVGYRRLGFGLDEIAVLLEADEESLVDHLRRQRDVVRSRAAELSELAATIERALERAMSDRPATREEMKEVFGDGFDDAHEAEAEVRWGRTDAWAQSQARTRRYTKADWEEVKKEAAQVSSAFVTAMESGEPATSAAAMDAAEAHRRHLHERFYDVSYDVHRGLAVLYLADPRFARTYEELAPGLAQYVHDAIVANAERYG